MKRKILTGICIVLLAALLIPIPLRLKDGGTVQYQAALYSVSNVHRLSSTGAAGSYETGLIIEILGFEVFNNVTTEAAEPFDIAVSYANWGDLNEIYSHALNIDKMVISSVRHLPIYKFDTKGQLDEFSWKK